jgi:hypothetical protein
MRCMDLNLAAKLLQTTLKRQKPSQFGSTWIYMHVPKVYWYFWKNVRTELGDIDWDLLTLKLDRSLQARWTRRKRRTTPYADIFEVELVLRKYLDKRYVFFTVAREDDELRNLISVALVRLAQKGNIKAEEELLELILFMAEDWIDRFPKLWRWKWYSHELREKCKSCIYRYRYTGTFTGYLYKTLEFSAYILPKPQLLDDTKLHGAIRKVDSVVQDSITGDLKIADYNVFHA